MCLFACLFIHFISIHICIYATFFCLSVCWGVCLLVCLFVINILFFHSYIQNLSIQGNKIQYKKYVFKVRLSLLVDPVDKKLILGK